jgi:hypothetical protein
MQEIDPVLFLQPALTMTMSVGAMLYWRHRRGLRGIVIGLSFAAYSIAIAAKTVVQLISVRAFTNAFGSRSLGFGLYLGLQTVILEIALAYVFAAYGTKR